MAKRTRPEDEASGDYAGQLAANLKRPRLERGLNHGDVAYRSGPTRYTSREHEKGKTKPGMPPNPAIRTLLVMSQTLGVALADIPTAARPHAGCRDRSEMSIRGAGGRGVDKRNVLDDPPRACSEMSFEVDLLSLS